MKLQIRLLKIWVVLNAVLAGADCIFCVYVLGLACGFASVSGHCQHIGVASLFVGSREDFLFLGLPLLVLCGLLILSGTTLYILCRKAPQKTLKAERPSLPCGR
ncbi:hypothetical protein [Thioclava sp. FTW29]|uniref:Uncharacterized protein n=1 Tax=Thioclava litoralis TaxID=3076557 RepID=A0ABZ1E4X6_9RHOB|nr:hypothetical protein RPE78_15230 [Thioclava sp. FTW29]